MTGECQSTPPYRKVNIRLPRKGNSNSHGARPAHQIITIIDWIRSSRLSIKNSLSAGVQKRGEAPSVGRRAATLLRRRQPVERARAREREKRGERVSVRERERACVTERVRE